MLSLVLLDTPHGALDEQSCREQLALYQRIAEKSRMMMMWHQIAAKPRSHYQLWRQA
ncbi:MAG: hypothetical protein U1E98_05520 [Moraxella osloensis]